MLWSGHAFWKPVVKYGVRHVEVLANMLKRHGGHDLTVVHDGTFDLPVHLDAVRMPDEVASLPDYQPKLWLWSPDLRETIGERFVAIDLDVIVLGDLGPLLDVACPVYLWNEAVGEPYNTSLFAVKPSAGLQVWEMFRDNPAQLARAARSMPRWTGDQSWVALILGPLLPTFGEVEGVVRYRPGRDVGGVPADTLAVFFCGPRCPATIKDDVKWVADNWR
jgi:hypothetical protein